MKILILICSISICFSFSSELKDTKIKTTALKQFLDGNTPTQRPRGKIKPPDIRSIDIQRGINKKNIIMRVIRARIPNLREPYNKYLVQNQELEGVLKLNITISEQGNISKIKVVETSLTNTLFVQEIIESIKEWNFVEIKNETNFSMPIEFKKS